MKLQEKLSVLQRDLSQSKEELARSVADLSNCSQELEQERTLRLKAEAAELEAFASKARAARTEADAQSSLVWSGCRHSDHAYRKHQRKNLMLFEKSMSRHEMILSGSLVALRMYEYPWQCPFSLMICAGRAKCATSTASAAAVRESTGKGSARFATFRDRI